MAFGDTLTINAKLTLIKPTRLNWADVANGNFLLLDAIIGTYFTVTNLKGPWLNSTAYVPGDTVVDTTTSSIWTCAVPNTSSPVPTTFLQERTAHPTYWAAFSTAAHARGAWSPNGTAYSVNDFVVAGPQYAVCIASHSSGATFAADVALGRWSILVDLSAAGSLVLPVPGGLGDANKFTNVNSAGTGYTIIDSPTARTILGVLPSSAYGTAATKDVGTAAGNVIQLDGAAKIPAVDGSQLTGLTSNQVSGSLAQTVITSSSVHASGTTIMPGDNTIPQQTEGDQYLSVTITPKNAASILEIEFQALWAINPAILFVTAAIFQDAAANAIASTSTILNGTATGQPLPMSFKFRVAAGSVTARTYKLRAGPSSAGTVVINSIDATNDFLGGTCFSFILVREYTP